MIPETNRLILAGTHERVYVAELQEGDITTAGEIVEDVQRCSDSRTVVYFVGGRMLSFGRADTTLIIEKR